MNFICNGTIRLIIDAIARIFVPIFITVISKKVVLNTVDTKRLDNIEMKIREHIQGCSDEEQMFMDKILKEAFSKPSMRWFR